MKHPLSILLLFLILLRPDPGFARACAMPRDSVKVKRINVPNTRQPTKPPKVTAADTLRVHQAFSKNGKTLKKYFITSIDSIRKLKGNKWLPNRKDTVPLKANAVVFGWHPYWMGDSWQAYKFSLLSHIAYFSYEVNPREGSCYTSYDWDTTSMIAAAKKANPNIKVLLTVTCFGKSTDTLFRSVVAQSSLIADLREKVMSRKADGVCIDFEDVSSAYKTQFLTFIQNLKNSFRANKLLVTITIPAVDYGKVYNIPTLNKSVDLYIMMAYDYFGGFSHYTGPIAPTELRKNWVGQGISSSVSYYQQNQIPDSSLIIGLPYFGSIWQTRTQSIPDSAVKFIGYRPYSYIVDGLLPKFSYDSLNQSMTYIYPDDGNVYRQFWIDGVPSLEDKYDYVIANKLGGVGIWALGFDNGSDDLWNLLQKKFTNYKGGGPTDTGTDSTAADSTHIPLPSGTSALVARIRSFLSVAESHIVMTGSLVFVVLLVLSLVLIRAWTNPANKDALKEKHLYIPFMVLSMLLFFLLISLMLLLGFNLPYQTVLWIDAAIMVVLVLVSMWWKQRQKQMP